MVNNTVKNDVTVLGIDLAKQSFQLHGVDKNSITLLKKKLARKNLCQFIGLMPACIIGIEACSGANH